VFTREDLNDSEFLPAEINALYHLYDKYEQYKYQGRDLEARGVSRSIGIIYSCLKGDFRDTLPTNHGDL
jgi:hypothetical protein